MQLKTMKNKGRRLEEQKACKRAILLSKMGFQIEIFKTDIFWPQLFYLALTDLSMRQEMEKFIYGTDICDYVLIIHTLQVFTTSVFLWGLYFHIVLHLIFLK